MSARLRSHHAKSGAGAGSGALRVGSLRLRHALAGGLLAALTALAASWGALRFQAGADGILVLASLTAILSIAGAGATWFLSARRFDALATVAHRMRQAGDAAGPGDAALPIKDEIDALGDALRQMLALPADAEARCAAAHEPVRDTGAMFAALFEHAPFGIALLHRDGRFARANDAYRKITGYTEEELGELREPDLTAPESVAADRQARETLKQGGACAPYEKEYLARGAIRVPVRISPFAPAAAGVNGLVWWIAEDLSVRRRLVEALKASETEARMLSAAFAHTSNLVLICDADGAIEWVNQAFVDRSGYTLEEIAGRKPGVFLQGPESDAATIAIMRAAIAARRGFAVEILNYARAGRAYWLAIECAPVFDHLGRLERFVAIGRDITAQRQAEQALRESEERHRRIVDTTRDVIFQFDREGRITLLNPAWERLTGHPLGDSLGRPFLEFMVPEQQAAGRQAIADIIDGRRRIFDELCCFVTQSGAARWFEVRAQVFAGPDGAPHCVGTLHDVHQRRIAEIARREAEEALRESRERYQRAIDGSQDGLWERDMRTGIFHFSERFDEILGHPPGGLPRETSAWRELIHRDDVRQHLDATVRMLDATTATMWEARVRTACGDYRWLRFRGIAFRDLHCDAILTSGTASDMHDAKLAQLELEAHRDNLTRLVEARTSGLAQATGAAEEARAAAEAARRQAVAASQSKSEFLANMSHELRTPMHAIISFAGFGVDKIDRVDHAKLLHYFRNIHKSGSRLLLLLNDLLDLSKFEAGKMEMRRQLTEMRGLIDDASSEVEALARSREIVLRVQVSAGLSAWVDATRMLQVLRNLLSNAIKFSADGGRVTLRCALLPAGADAGATPSVELCVSDEGIGIPEDELDAVFDKFVQSSKTKTGAGGTGLGLAICREIVAAHGGTIHARNNPAPAQGVTFVLRFPALAGAQAVPRVLSGVC